MEKIRYDLIPTIAMKSLAEAMTFGLFKYGENDWRENHPMDDHYRAIFSHMLAWRSGERNDQESGLNHLAHAIARLAMLIETEDYKKRKQKENDYGY